MPVKTIDTATLHFYRRSASGMPIVFLHGALRRGACFSPLTPYLGKQWQVHSLDLRGHGASPRANRFRVIDYVADVMAFLRGNVQGPAVLVGHSLGAMVALALAAEAPDLVRAVILEDPPFHTMGERIRQTPLHSYFSALRPLAGSREPVGALVRRLASLEVLSPDMRSHVKLGQLRELTALRFMACCLRDVNPAVMEPILAGQWMDDYPTERILAAVSCPALLFQCDQAAGGMLHPVDGDLFARLVPDCTKVYLNGVGHQAHWTATPTVSGYLLEFLASLEGSSE